MRALIISTFAELYAAKNRGNRKEKKFSFGYPSLLKGLIYKEKTLPS